MPAPVADPKLREALLSAWAAASSAARAISSLRTPHTTSGRRKSGIRTPRTYADLAAPEARGSDRFPQGFPPSQPAPPPTTTSAFWELRFVRYPEQVPI